MIFVLSADIEADIKVTLLDIPLIFLLHWPAANPMDPWYDLYFAGHSTGTILALGRDFCEIPIATASADPSPFASHPKNGPPLRLCTIMHNYACHNPQMV
jgi:hypothetical protein